MKNSKILIALAFCASLFTACKDQLDVKNPNDPTPESASTEAGVLSLAQGGVYVNGFRGLSTKYNDGVPGYFWSGAVGIHSLLGDEIGEEAANWYGNQIACPNFVTFDDGTKLANPQSPSTQYGLLNDVNDNANQGSNPIFHEWANMYGLNNACNSILTLSDKVTFKNDATKNTVKAWAFFWKGFAYSRIGSMYIAGVINNEPGKADNKFVTKEAIIAEATKNFDTAAGLLGGSIDAGALGKIIPSFCQTGKGGIPSADQWKRIINTMKARNILVNKTVAAMSAADWASVASLTANGIQAGAAEVVFVGITNEAGDIWSPTGGSVAAKTVSTAPGKGTYKLSERLVQDFKADDKRRANFGEGTLWLGNNDRGTVFNTRYFLKDGAAADFPAGIQAFGSITSGAAAGQIFLCGSYEENALMAAEAKIYTGDLAGGLKIIDEVRTSQGAGLPATAVGTADAAKAELRVERRCALAFRGLAFYDARRWEVIENGKGRKGCVVVDKAGKVNTNASIEYGFLDYWNVPDNELAYNTPAEGSAPIVNPKNPK
jgi:hypothetical protein